MITQATTHPNGATKTNKRMSKHAAWSVFVQQRDSLTYTKYVIFRRDNFRCRYCDCDLLASFAAWKTATLDHIWPRRMGGLDGKSNTVACCQTCNWLKADAPTTTIEEARDYIDRRRVEATARLTEVLGSIGIDFPRKPAAHPINQPAMESLARLLQERVDSIVSAMMTAIPATVEVTISDVERQVPR